MRTRAVHHRRTERPTAALQSSHQSGQMPIQGHHTTTALGFGQPRQGNVALQTILVTGALLEPGGGGGGGVGARRGVGAQGPWCN